MRLTDRQAVLCALDDAIQWQQEFRSANLGFDAEQVAEADKRIAAYRRVYGRMTGGEATFREIAAMQAMRGAKVITFTEIRRRIESGELPAHTKEP